LSLKEGEYCQAITKTGDHFVVTTNKDKYETKAVLIATGAKRRKLTVPGADKFENKGLTYCASCDGPLFADMDVAVIGGGNAGFETCAQLLAYCKSVTLLNRSDHFKADEITIGKILSNPKMKAIKNAELMEIHGDKFINAVSYKDKPTGKINKLDVSGVFAEIGSIPATDFAKEILKMDEFGRIVTDPKNGQTSLPGVWSAGDCTDGLYHQNNIAMGDAVKALEDIYMWLQTH
jgi:alkyl hydroperoxide reductase subunit F